MNIVRSLVLLAPLAAVSVASAQSLFGLNQATSGGAVSILRINPTTGATTTLYNAGAISGDVNGLAFDGGSFFFQNGSRDLFRTSTAGTVRLGRLSAVNSNATWHKGAYWYVPQNSSQIRRVTFGINGALTDTLFYAGQSGKSFGFGDIQFGFDGKLRLSTDEGFYSFDVNRPAGGFTLANSRTPMSQLGYSGGNLYGIASGGSTSVVEKVYSINAATGVATFTANVQNGANIYIRDAAGQPVPEPATMAVLGLGALGLLRRRAKRA